MKQKTCLLNEGNVLIFLHLPKTAGSTLNVILARKYTLAEKFWMNCFRMEDSIQQFKNLPDKQRDRIKLIWGHIPYGVHDMTPKPSVYMTMLRHPVERIISLYYFILTQYPEHYLHKEMIAKKMTLEEFVNSAISTELDNFQTRLLSGVGRDIPFGECTQKLADKAIANLQNHFIFVGIQEKFNESVILLQRTIGIKHLPLYKSVNITKDRLPYSAIPSHLIEEIEKRNQFDFQVYAYAQERFHKDLSQMGITDQELKRFMMLNNWYGMLTKPVDKISQPIQTIGRQVFIQLKHLKHLFTIQ